jgi:hypothetical protein
MKLSTKYVELRLSGRTAVSEIIYASILTLIMKSESLSETLNTDAIFIRLIAQKEVTIINIS